MNKVQVSAPSNIALIKYMGKTSTQNNLPTNSSLSWTIEAFRTFVQITLRDDLKNDEWSPLSGEDFQKLELSEKSQERFLSHFKNLKEKFGIKESFLLESGNNFASDCGLASSASSFAALTMAATEMFAQLNEDAKYLSIEEKASLSRVGSGSSCRSFFGPWSLWGASGVRPVEFPMHQLLHQVLVIESGKKEVSSSDAHRRVVTSPLFPGRPERAEARLAELMQTFRTAEEPESWKKAYDIVWDEFMDMHELFETSQPAFSYMLPGTRQALTFLKNLWQDEQDGPLVTMDAGANIHLLYRRDQAKLRDRIKDHFKGPIQVIQGDLVE